jgi:NAD(P)H dehydrogenase (quinone)
MMARRILVTGATGTVGGAVMRALRGTAQDGRITLLGAARSAASAERLRQDGFTPVTLDFDAPETLRPALRGVDGVFLLTGYSVDMLVQAKRVLDAARDEGVDHIVHLGALAAENTPHAHFAWHQLIERAVQGMGFRWTHLHPNFFMDTVWNGFVHRPDRLVHFVGDRRVSFISSDDMAAVAAAALRDPGTHAGQRYPLAVEALTFAELAGILSEVTERPVTYRPRPAADLLAIMERMGAEPMYARGLCDGVAEIERGGMPEAGAVFDTVTRVLNRPPVLWRDFAAARLHQIAR